MLLGSRITLSRGSRTILRELSITICPGELIAVLGPSGSGKSTLLKVLAGLVPPSSGAVSLEGRDLAGLPELERARLIGHVPQDDIIHIALSVESILRYAALLRFPQGTPESEVQAAVARVIDLTGLTERRTTRVRRLSGGQRKRVSLGVELLLSPRFLFLDEPTSGLDPALEEDMMRLFGALARAGHGVVTTTHSVASLDLADALLIVVEGRLAFFGPPNAAAAHFEVGGIAEVFRALRSRDAAEWEARFRASPLAPRASQARQPQGRAKAAPVDPKQERTNPKPGAAAAAQPSPSVDALLAQLSAELEAEEGRQ